MLAGAVLRARVGTARSRGRTLDAHPDRIAGAACCLRLRAAGPVPASGSSGAGPAGRGASSTWLMGHNRLSLVPYGVNSSRTNNRTAPQRRSNAPPHSPAPLNIGRVTGGRVHSASPSSLTSCTAATLSSRNSNPSSPVYLRSGVGMWQMVSSFTAASAAFSTVSALRSPCRQIWYWA